MVIVTICGGMGKVLWFANKKDNYGKVLMKMDCPG